VVLEGRTLTGSHPVSMAHITWLRRLHVCLNIEQAFVVKVRRGCDGIDQIRDDTLVG
jgi:hypothetical protein